MNTGFGIKSGNRDQNREWDNDRDNVWGESYKKRRNLFYVHGRSRERKLVCLSIVYLLRPFQSARRQFLCCELVKESGCPEHYMVMLQHQFKVDDERVGVLPSTARLINRSSRSSPATYAPHYGAGGRRRSGQACPYLYRFRARNYETFGGKLWSGI
ncbi:hypothetical protein EVAR_41372_1 [Eumeta japonica]|uniref:Uncharacterized protein n=1 Tax=Eumeta variegata TaxID=151549 RepID=A0A4C1WXB8_EUMVA|nr:hypothetical protein EVAR_41372_1 [Eumeta japonica]